LTRRSVRFFRTSGVRSPRSHPGFAGPDAQADTAEQAAILRARSELMQKIAAIVRDHPKEKAPPATQVGAVLR
jgi:hypothetical protein